MEYIDVNDNYEPVEPNYYDYKVVNNLDKNINHLLNLKNTEIKSIKIFAFEVNNEAIKPFLKLFLYKNEYNETLNFLSLDFNEDFIDTDIIQLQSKIYLYTFLNLNNFNEFLETIDYKGCYVENKNLYIFFDLTKCKLLLHDIYRDSKIWICLLDEIVNEAKVCNFDVSQDVIDFFIDNLDFCFLYNKNGEKYNLPIAGYSTQEDRLLNFTYMFGVSKSNNNSIFGPYYYFTKYDNAINQIDLLRDKIKEKQNKKVGIVRFALFLENIKFIDNYQNNTKTENVWADKYDSIFLRNVETSNEKLLNECPLIVLKNYEQQSSLSYHYINKLNKII